MTPPQYIGGPKCGETVIDGVEQTRVFTDPMLHHYNPPRQIMGSFEYTKLGSGDYRCTDEWNAMQADGVG